MIIAGQIYKGAGNAGGTYISEEGNSYINRGFSVFGEAKILPTNFALISRIDRHHVSGGSIVDCSSVIAGICYRFLENNKLLLNTDIRNRNGSVTRFYEAAVEIRF
ncbi:MAG: hypothetical protein R6W67_09225 [Bacteroidales bacterium]